MMRKLNKQNQFNQLNEYLGHEKEDAFRESLMALHIQDRVEWFQNLDSPQMRKMVYKYLTAKQLANIFQGLKQEEQIQMMQEMNREQWIATLNEMASDDVSDFLNDLEESQVVSVLNEMDAKMASRVKQILEYEFESAGSLMATEYISLKTTETISKVMERLREEGPDAETIYYLYVTDEAGKLTGVISLRDLITSDPAQTISEIMSDRVVSVHVSQDQEEVARLIQKYDFLAAPVVKDDDELVGIITVDDILDVIEEEMTEDIGEISATRGATDPNMSAIDAAKKRAPWIVMLMFLGLITAEVIGQFEETLEQIVLLAAFIPLIMDSAGNTGTQSLAVMVRNLAIGSFERKDIWKVLRRELFAGMMIGVGSATTLALLIVIFYEQNLILAGVVGTSIFLSLSIATVIGSFIPLIINKFKIDPAVASGPFITTINDILGLLIYFTIATSMIDYLL
ncbi:magnesium transporter [Halalkalibacillus halophilus]|uniref:magnesium transporter n=1 Tax=Halalkalibacillus halophilus TaxID=392827 RepID=UPI00041A664C